MKHSRKMNFADQPVSAGQKLLETFDGMKVYLLWAMVALNGFLGIRSLWRINASEMFAIEENVLLILANSYFGLALLFLLISFCVGGSNGNKR